MAFLRPRGFGFRLFLNMNNKNQIVFSGVQVKVNQNFLEICRLVARGQKIFTHFTVVACRSKTTWLAAAVDVGWGTGACWGLVALSVEIEVEAWTVTFAPVPCSNRIREFKRCFFSWCTYLSGWNCGWKKRNACRLWSFFIVQVVTAQVYAKSEALRGVSKTSISCSSESGCFAALCVVKVVDVVADPTSFNCSTFAGLTVEPTSLGDATSRDSFD